MQSEKRNMERMAEVVLEADEQVLQHFLSNSPWDENEVMDHVASDADVLLGGTEDSAFYLDESAFKKQGKKSVGVARQWNGRLGKVDNCQVGVYAALGKGDRVCMTGARLYLPKEWTENKARCDKAKVPAHARHYQTKIDLALELVRHARQSGMRYHWVGMDSFYGRSGELLRTLDDEEETFMADVPCDQLIYLQDPSPYIPPQSRATGRRRTRYHSDAPATTVQQWASEQPEQAWQRKTLRSATKGKLRIEVLHRRIWLWDKSSAIGRCWHLIVRREIDSPETLKYSLCNAPTETSTLRLARMQAQRYWIERAFQDAKSHLGMAQYQARGWSAWHRHMALVMMAQLFMLEEREGLQESYPLLSCYDIQIILARTLPSQQRDEDEMIRQMDVRHRKRQAAIESAARAKRRVGNKTVGHAAV